MQFELSKLKNNLNVLFVNSPGSTAGTVQIWFRAGSALENFENEGIAHFLEHMFFKGTETRPGAKIAHDVESFGGEINAFTSFDYTCYYINTPNNNLNNSVEILMDMVSNPMFKQDELIPERGVVFEEYRRSIDSPNQFGFTKLQESSFTGPYAHPILGREETIKNFSQEQLKTFRKNFYNLQNSMLIVSGDLSNKDEIIKSIEKHSMPSGNESIFPKFNLKSSPTIDLHEKEVRMSSISIITNAPEYSSKEAAAEDLAINCIGFGETSRLYKSLVLDKTIANNASSSTMFMAHGGAHFIRIVFPPENLNEVIKKVLEVLNELIKDGFTPDEVNKIKNQYLSSKVYEQESIESFSFSLGHSFAQTGNIHADEEFISRIKKTSNAEVNKAVKNLFTNNFHLSMQIPKSSAPTTKVKKSLEKFQVELKKIRQKIIKEAKSKLEIKSSHFDSQAKYIKIKPGITLFYRQNLMTPTFVLQAYVRGGLTEENEKTNGTYHLLSSMLTKGYGKISNDKLKNDLEEKSASINGFAGKNAYGLLMHGLSDNLSELSAHFVGCLTDSKIPQKHLNHEKQLTLRAIENHKEDPVKHCFREAHRLFFTTHPYALNPIGTIKSLRQIKDQSLLKIHKQNLKTKELLITYCGDENLETILELLAPMFDKLPSRKSVPIKFKKYKSITNVEKYISFDREQTQIFYGIPCGKMNSPENFYLKMLTTHLSGQSSELFVEVRDKQGLCYSAQPVHFSALEGGYFGIYMASGHDKVSKAVIAIKDLIGKIQQNGLSENDFNRIKMMIKGQNLINVQTNEDFASIYSVPLLQGEGVDYYHQKNIDIENLTYKDFQTNIKKILSAKWNTVIVGRENGLSKAM
jgi:zinc protease